MNPYERRKLEEIHEMTKDIRNGMCALALVLTLIIILLIIS